MKLLSELDSNTMLKIGDEWDLMTKEEFLKSEFFNIQLYPDIPEVWTVHDTVLKFSLEKVIEQLGEDEVHEDWADAVWYDIQSSGMNVAEIENKINEIFQSNPTYWEDEEVEIDVHPQKKNENETTYYGGLPTYEDYEHGLKS